MAGVPAESEVTDGHRGGRRTEKDTKLECGRKQEEDTGRQRQRMMRNQVRRWCDAALEDDGEEETEVVRLCVFSVYEGICPS